MNEVGAADADRVADLVRMTASHVVPSDADLATMVVHDVDLVDPRVSSRCVRPVRR